MLLSNFQCGEDSPIDFSNQRGFQSRQKTVAFSNICGFVAIISTESCIEGKTLIRTVPIEYDTHLNP